MSFWMWVNPIFWLLAILAVGCVIEAIMWLAAKIGGVDGNLETS